MEERNGRRWSGCGDVGVEWMVGHGELGGGWDGGVRDQDEWGSRMFYIRFRIAGLPKLFNSPIGRTDNTMWRVATMNLGIRTS